MANISVHTSVHLVTYNSAATIEACLASLAAQRDADFSALIVDNASTDDTVARAARFGYPVIANPANTGYAAAQNQALAQTDSRYVLTLNPDVRLDPDFLRSMVETLEAQPKVGSAAGCLMRVDHLDMTPQVIDGAGLFMRRNRRQGLRCDGLPLSDCPAQPIPIFGPDGAAAFYRRAMLDDIQVEGEVFDTDFFMHKEDVDVCWRAQLHGWSSVYAPQAKATHIRGFRPGQRQQRETLSPTMRSDAIRNRYLMMIKNEIAAHFLRDLPPILVYDLAMFGYVLLRERQSLSAYRSAWALRSRMLHKRRIIQNRRTVGWRDMARWFSASNLPPNPPAPSPHKDGEGVKMQKKIRY